MTTTENWNPKRKYKKILIISTILIVIIILIFHYKKYKYCMFSFQTAIWCIIRQPNYVDCMPSPDKEEMDLCKRARDSGYPYIVY